MTFQTHHWADLWHLALPDFHPIIITDYLKALICLATLATITIVLRYLAYLDDPWHETLPSPPGPPLLPFIGRIHDLPATQMSLLSLKFNEWAKQYGPIYRTRMFGETFIIISDQTVCEDLLVKRADIYSDRPGFGSVEHSKGISPMTAEYLPFMGNNEYFVRQRRLATINVRTCQNARYWGILETETVRWLERLLEKPDDFYAHLEYMTAAISCRLGWGKDEALNFTIEACLSLSKEDEAAEKLLAYRDLRANVREEDNVTEITELAQDLMTAISPGGKLTNAITPLLHIPYAMNPWRRSEAARRQTQRDRWVGWYEQVKMKSKIDESLAPSLTHSFLQRGGVKAAGLADEHEAASALGMFSTIGTILASPIGYMLQALVCHPEWQKRCQNEIDDLGGRMPEISDIDRLPTLRACIRETMRWRPTVPTGVAHQVERDDWYRGYFIPKGSRILPLEWALCRDATTYPDPESFRPERWLQPGWPTYQEPLTQYPTVMGSSSFGWGRRVCPGQAIMRDATIVCLGGLLWAFNLGKKQSQDGSLVEIPIHPRYSEPRLITKPMPFQISFEIRDEWRKDKIRIESSMLY